MKTGYARIKIYYVIDISYMMMMINQQVYIIANFTYNDSAVLNKQASYDRPPVFLTHWPIETKWVRLITSVGHCNIAHTLAATRAKYNVCLSYPFKYLFVERNNGQTRVVAQEMRIATRTCYQIPIKGEVYLLIIAPIFPQNSKIPIPDMLNFYNGKRR